jgi:hypothetical protein
MTFPDEATMDIHLADQRIFALSEKITSDQAKQRAMDKRVQIFISGLGSMLLQRPKAEEIELIGTQKRFEPFWHVVCATRHVYDRTSKFNVPVAGAEVKSITLQGMDYSVANHTFTISGVEHCTEENRQQIFVNGVSGEKEELSAIINNPKNEVTDLNAFTADNKVIVVPPETRASFVMRQILQPMLKPVQADVIHEEAVTIETIDLYYRPIYAFEFKWKPKDKTGVAEFDGVTGEMRNAKALLQQMNIPITRNALFDIGADTLSMLVPGANIALKLARVALDKDKY